MPDPLLLYGATGFTGRLILDSALALGLRPRARRARRQPSSPPWPTRSAWRGAPPASPTPPSSTPPWPACASSCTPPDPSRRPRLPMAAACLRAGAHYLDVTGEIPVIERLAQRDREAASARHHDHARRRLRRRAVRLPRRPRRRVVCPRRPTLPLGLTGLAFATRGSASTLAEHAGIGVNVRRGGVITPVAPGALRQRFDFGDGRATAATSAGATSPRPTTPPASPTSPSTSRRRRRSRRCCSPAARSVGCCAPAPGRHGSRRMRRFSPKDRARPSGRPREMVIVAEASDARGRTARARLRTPEAYTFTGLAAPAIARRVLARRLRAGLPDAGPGLRRRLRPRLRRRQARGSQRRRLAALHAARPTRSPAARIAGACRLPTFPLRRRAPLVDSRGIFATG